MPEIRKNLYDLLILVLYLDLKHYFPDKYFKVLIFRSKCFLFCHILQVIDLFSSIFMIVKHFKKLPKHVIYLH